MTGLDTQFSLGFNQCPKSLIDAQNVIENHSYDENYRERRNQRNKERNRQEKEKETTDEDKPTQLTFAQMKNVCYYCCGGRHKLTDCPKKDTIPRSEWHINKTKELSQTQAMAAEINKAMTENDAESTTPSSVTDSNFSNARFNVQGLNRSWQLFQTGCALATKTKLSLSDELEKTMILLDSGSSINLFCNENWLDNRGTQSFLTCFLKEIFSFLRKIC